METKLLNILPLPSPQKNYCFVGMLHTFPRKSKLFPTSLSVLQIATSPQIQCDFPLYSQLLCYNSPCTLLSWHLCIAGKSEEGAKGKQVWHRGRKRNFASPPGMGGTGRLRHKTHTRGWRLLSREKAADEHRHQNGVQTKGLLLGHGYTPGKASRKFPLQSMLYGRLQSH